MTAPAEPGSLGGAKEIFDLIEPATAASLKGVLSPDHTSVQATARPGTWYPTRYDISKDAGKKIILYFYGGAYVLGGHQPSLYKDTLDKMLPALDGAKFFSVGYRLASSAGNHFLAQLIDAVSAYQHLLKQGIQPTQIVLLGDSTGGHLVFALLRYMVDNQGLLPLPVAACAACPWLDLSLDMSKLAQHRNAKRDIVTQPLLQWGVDCFVASNVKVTDPYISPGLHPFIIPVPIWIEVDGNEVLFDSVVKFTDGLKAIATNDVEIHIREGGTHATLMWGLVMGFKERVDESISSMREFLLERKIL